MLAQIRSFLTVVEEGSLYRAAARLRISQPAGDLEDYGRVAARQSSWRSEGIAAARTRQLKEARRHGERAKGSVGMILPTTVERKPRRA